MHTLLVISLVVLGQAAVEPASPPAESTPPAGPSAPVPAPEPAPAALAAPAPASRPPAEPSPLFDSLVTDIEVGPAYLFQNDGRYGANGTAYSAADVGQQRNLALALRIALEARIARHTIIATWAPLDLTTRTTLTRDLTFRDTTFANGSVLDHRYLFEGYRLSYLFGIVQIPRFYFGAGLSLQVRNASVEFRTVDTSPPVFAVERDIGLVGAIKLRARFDAGVLYAQADVDFFNTFGLGLPAGIHDAALTLGIPVFKGFDVLLRVRLVGGGASVPSRDIFNWGNFGFALAGVRVDLPVLWSQR